MLTNMDTKGMQMAWDPTNQDSFIHSIYLSKRTLLLTIILQSHPILYFSYGKAGSRRRAFIITTPHLKKKSKKLAKSGFSLRCKIVASIRVFTEEYLVVDGWDCIKRLSGRLCKWCFLIFCYNYSCKSWNWYVRHL